MSDEAVTPGGTVLDDLVYLAEGRIANKRAEERPILVPYILDKLAVSEIGPAEVRMAALTVLANVAARARSEANSRLEEIEKDGQLKDEAFQVAAAGELLGIKYDESEFVHVRDRYCKAENQTWEALKRITDNGNSPGRVRQLRAGIWIGQGYKSAQKKRRELLQSFESALVAYLTSPELSAQEEIAKLRASLVVASKLSRVVGSDQSDSINRINDAPIVDRHVSVVETRSQYELAGNEGRLARKIITYLRRHRVLIAVELLYVSTLTLSFLVPATSQEPWAWLDGVLGLDGVLYGQHQPIVVSLLWGSLLLFMGLAALTNPRSKFFRILLASAIFVSCLEVAGHLVTYYQDTGEARGLQSRVRGGNSLIAEEFDVDGPCPAPISEFSSPVPKLTSCEINGGVLHARQINPTFPNMGMYSRGDLWLSSHDDFDYYMETRFQARGTTPIAACGIAVLISQNLYWFFHVKLERQPNGLDDYTGEVLDIDPTAINLRTEIGPNPTATPGKWLPFVLKTSLPGSGYGTWTTLSILIHSDRTTFFVDDRLAGSVAGVPKNSQAGLAVNVLSESYVSGDAACDFDYFHVQQLVGN